MTAKRDDDDEPSAPAELVGDGATFPETLATRTVSEVPSIGDGEPDAGDDELAGLTHVGRYELLGLLGRGGMGVVYRARDPDLDRVVALKLLRVRTRATEGTERARQRLLREAQALAALAHPNVVAVHDVGRFGDGVFIAMEHVEGVTLRALLRDARQPRERVVALLLDAGRGLAAAHRAGMVHRDFKPANVIVGDDGRVRVLDFGLARAPALDSDDGASLESSDSGARAQSGTRSGGALLSSPLTRHGELPGTPAYMAPEQFRGTADARSDQFSFCLVLCEALTGTRPETGERGEDLDLAACERALTGSGAPRWLRRVVLRGLARRPDDRYPSMDALLAELGRDVRAQRRAVVLAATVLALAGVATWAVVARPGGAGAAPCRDAARALTGVWDDGVRARVRAAFEATGLPHAPDTFALVAGRFDAFTDDWIARRTATCEAHHVAGELSAHQMDLRMACLQRRLDMVRARIGVLGGEVDAALLAEAPRLSARLPALADCANDAALLAAFPPPTDAGELETLGRLERAVDDADALLQAGETGRGLEALAAITGEVDALDHPPLSARTYVTLGNLQLDNGELAAADDTLKRAGLAAARAGDAAGEAHVWILRMRGMLLQARFDDALELAEPAELAVVRAQPDDELRADFDYSMAWLFIMTDRRDDARRHAEAALALWTRAAGPGDARVAMAHIALGNLAATSGDHDDAVAHFRTALDIQSAALGPRHPDLAQSLHNLAYVLVDMGRADDALPYAQRALDLTRGVFGDDHVETASRLWMLGRIEHARGHHDTADGHVARALAIYGASADADPSEVAYASKIHGDIALAQGRPRDALERYRRARAGFVEVFGPEDSQVTDLDADIAAAESFLQPRRLEPQQ